MSQADLERELEAAAPSGPEPELERKILAAVEDRLAREGTRRRALLTAGAVAVLMAGIFVLGMQAGTRTERGMPSEEADVAGDPEGPRIVLDLPATGLDFGEQRQGVVVEQDVVFRNRGGASLTIRRVANGCGCIKATLVGEATELQPGEQGRIRVRLDTKGKDGVILKTVTLYTNEVARPLVKFRVHTHVALGLRISTTLLDFGRATSGHATEARVRLRTPKAESGWKVVDVRGTNETDGAVVDYTWRVEEIPDPQDVVRELVVVHPGLAAEGTSFQDRILVRTTYPGRGEIPLRAHLLVVKPILAVPRRAVLGYVPSHLPPPRIRLVPGDPNIRFRILGVALEPADGSGFEAGLGRDPDGAPWIEVRYDGKARETGVIRAVVVVRTDLEQMPEVRIDCYATVSR